VGVHRIALVESGDDSEVRINLTEKTV